MNPPSKRDLNWSWNLYVTGYTKKKTSQNQHLFLLNSHFLLPNHIAVSTMKPPWGNLLAGRFLGVQNLSSKELRLWSRSAEGRDESVCAESRGLIWNGLLKKGFGNGGANMFMFAKLIVGNVGWRQEWLDRVVRQSQTIARKVCVCGCEIGVDVLFFKTPRVLYANVNLSLTLMYQCKMM